MSSLAPIWAWWRAAPDYDHSVQYLRQLGARRIQEILIGLASYVYGVASILSAVYFHQGNGRPYATEVAVAIAVTSVGIGTVWVLGKVTSERMSLAFAFYADLSVIVVVLCYQDYFLACPGLALLAANGVYFAFHHGAHAVTAHFAISVAAMCWCIVGAVLDGVAPGVLIAIRTLVLVPTVLAVPVVLLPLMRLFRSDALGALHDTLTGLCNRRGMAVRADELVSAGYPVAVLVIDIDKFKTINDRFGHAAGDVVLMDIADAMRAAAPRDAVLARLGGEEFAILVRRECGSEIARRLHELSGLVSASAPRSMSVGVATASSLESQETLTELIARADSAMYRAKEQGGGRTVEA